MIILIWKWVKTLNEICLSTKLIINIDFFKSYKILFTNEPLANLKGEFSALDFNHIVSNIVPTTYVSYVPILFNVLEVNCSLDFPYYDFYQLGMWDKNKECFKIKW